MFRSLPLLLVFGTACAALNPEVQRGDALAARGEWELALDAYEEAASHHPEDPAVLAKRDLARRQVADRYLLEARDRRASGEWQAAKAALDRAQGLAPDHHGLPRERAALARAAAEAADARLSDGDAPGAFQLARLAAEVLPKDPQLAAKLAAARKAYGAYLRNQAAAFEEQDLYGAALAAWTALAAADPTAPQSDDRRERLAVALELGASWSVAFPGLAAGDMEARRIAQGIRQTLQSAAAPQSCPALHLLSTTETPPGVRLTGSVVEAKWMDEETQARERVEWQTGTKQVPNPERKAAQEEVAAAEQRLRDAVESLKHLMEEESQAKVAAAEAGPDDDLTALQGRLAELRAAIGGARRSAQEAARTLEAARRRLASTPKRVSQPILEAAELVRTEVRRTLRATVRISIRDLATGRLHADEVPLEAEATTTDAWHRGLPQAGISKDPLKF
ncbi:MAG: hypothetical protein D6729_19675, partial [Deltaproteobacteria bacterium]